MKRVKKTQKYPKASTNLRQKQSLEGELCSLLALKSTHLLQSVCLDIKNLITALCKKVDCISLCSKLFSFQSWPICVITFVKSIQFASNFLSIMALAYWQPRRVLSSLSRQYTPRLLLLLHNEATNALDTLLSNKQKSEAKRYLELQGLI